MKKAKNRFLFFAVLASIGFFIIFARIFYFAALSENLEISSSPRFMRGSIQDRNGLNLAITEETSTIGIAPEEIQDAEFTAKETSRYLKIPEEEVIEKMYRYKHRRYFLLKRQVDNYDADRLLELNLPGVHRESEYSRHYPGETLASNLLGFVGRDQRNALGGIELIYHDILSTPPDDSARIGAGLQLSIDSLIQYQLEDVLSKAFENSGAKRAAGIIMNLETGEIAAVANFPNFNPNRYYASRPEERGNWAFRLNFEPGSTVKIFMAAILLQEKALNRNERFFCDGEIKFKDVNVRCKHKNKVVSHGNLTIDEILKHSCNVGIIKAMLRVRRDRLHYYLEKLQFGEKTNLLMGSGETSGYLPGLNSWPAASSYYVPIGQGFSVTPIQILKAASSIAAGGRLYDPVLVKYIKHSDGRILDEKKIHYSMNPFDSDVNKSVLKMMRGVVEGGTAVRANIPEVKISGKTGTAQKSTAKGYFGYISSFIGFFPEENPLYGGIILFDEPEGDQGGGLLAAPAFAEVAKRITILKDSREKMTVLKKLPSFTASKGSFNPNFIYDFRNLSARESLDIIHRYNGLKIEIKGSGYVYKQIPEPGTPVRETEKLILHLDY